MDTMTSGRVSMAGPFCGKWGQASLTLSLCFSKLCVKSSSMPTAQGWAPTQILAGRSAAWPGPPEDSRPWILASMDKDPEASAAYENEVTGCTAGAKERVQPMSRSRGQAESAHKEVGNGHNKRHARKENQGDSPHPNPLADRCGPRPVPDRNHHLDRVRGQHHPGRTCRAHRRVRPSRARQPREHLLPPPTRTTHPP